jgi:hypothetical protein
MTLPIPSGSDGTARYRYLPRGQGFDATTSLFYECALEDPSYLEVFCYTDRQSYRAGEEVRFHASSTAVSVSIEIVRDGATPESVATLERVDVPLTPLARGFQEDGCAWPVVARWTVPTAAPSGFYLVVARGRDRHGNVRRQEHGFFVRPPAGSRTADLLFVSAMATWTAYNDWGGANHYLSALGPDGFVFAPRLSLERPWARGLIALPPNAPRKPHDPKLPPGSIHRYPPIEFAHTRGYTKWYANAGWATYERPFAVWAERNGYRLDFATQYDLGREPQLLDGYRAIILVGHDEYWSWEQREAVHRWIERGGRVARFAGNFGWQIRMERNDTLQVCYKDQARAHDPLLGTERERRLTTAWEDPIVGWPGASTFGLNTGWGIYALVGGLVARGSGGFTVYRPRHWSFAGTDLGYGDQFGAEARIFGYEVDGLDYTFRDGLPFPTFRDGAPESVEILAMGLAANSEPLLGHPGEVSYYGDSAPGLATIRFGTSTPDQDQVGTASRGAGMMVHFTLGAGEVFHAGSCEWVAGLAARDVMTESITRNVLDRFGATRSP